MSEDAQTYDFVQQTPPARESVDPRVKAFIDAENRALLAQVQPKPSQPSQRNGGFGFIAPTPPARRGFNT